MEDEHAQQGTKEGEVVEPQSQDNEAKTEPMEVLDGEANKTAPEEDEPALPSPFFQGAIVQAIAKAKADNCVFIVTLQGEDDAPSKQMDEQTWSHPEVHAILQTVVALRLIWNSPDGKNFLAFYPAFVLPTIYFISPGGAPLAILSGFQSPEQFLAKLEEVTEGLRNPPPPVHQQAPPPSTTIAPPHETEPLPTPADPTPETPTQTITTTTTSTSPPVVQATATEQPSPSSPSQQLTLEEHKARAQQKLQEIKKQREEEEKRLERERELNRRRNGKELIEAQKKSEEAKRKREADEKRRERQEEKLAKQRIKEKIERDKMERKARAAQISTSGGGSTTTTTTQPTTHTITKLVFKLLNGESLKHEFPVRATLGDCRDHIQSTCGYSDFGMMMNFPRRVFASEDYDKDLLELGLVPSGTIIITGSSPEVKSQGQQAEQSGSFISSISNFVWGFFSSAPQQDTTQPSPPPETRMPDTRRPTQSGLRSRGNVHQLSHEDDNQDTATWNGNSTQQY